MAKKCYVCEKSPRTGHRVSHSNVKTKRKWSANLQKIKALIDGSTKRVNVCTRCLKAGKVERAL